MNAYQKTGGFAALYQAIAYLIGMVFFLVVVDYQGATDPIQRVLLLVENEVGMYATNIIIYVVFGIALVVLSLALHERLRQGSPALMQVATVFGLIWATVVIASGMIFNIGMERVIGLYAIDPTQAATVWLSIHAVFNGMGGGVEILGGLWSLLVSWAGSADGRLIKAIELSGRSRWRGWRCDHRPSIWRDRRYHLRSGSDRLVCMAGDCDVAQPVIFGQGRYGYGDSAAWRGGISTL